MLGMKHLVIKDVPEELGLRFKATCILKKTTMRDVVIQLIKEWLEKANTGKS